MGIPFKLKRQKIKERSKSKIDRFLIGFVLEQEILSGKIIKLIFRYNAKKRNWRRTKLGF